MISNATSGIKALRLSDQFGSSAGSPFESGLDALKDTVIAHGPAQAAVEQTAGMGAEISPLESFFDSLGGRNRANAEPQAGQPANQAQLQQELKAVLGTGKTWKPTDHLNNNHAASNTVQNRHEGNAKLDNADQKIAALKTNVQDIARKMNNGAEAGPGQAAGAAAGPQSPSMLGSLAGGLVRDAAVTGGLTAMGMPFAAAAYGAATLAVSLNGRGTLGVANSGEFTKTTTDRKGRVIDAGYTRSESPSPASGPAAPQNSASLWNKLAQGPGFGRDGRKVDAETAGLAGQSLTGIAALKLAENSPAMAAYQSQRMDGEEVRKIHEARISKGLVADEPNLSRAMAIGLPETALNQRAMLPGMHI